MKKHIHQDLHQGYKSRGDTDNIKANTQWGWVNKPIRPSIKLLLLLPLGFGISMIWHTLTYEREAADYQPMDEIGFVIQEGLVLLFLLTILIALPTYLIVGHRTRKYMQPVFIYFFGRWKHLIFGMMGVSLLYSIGLFSSIESVISGQVYKMPPILHFGVGFILVIILSEMSVRIGKLLFLFFADSRMKDRR